MSQHTQSPPEALEVPEPLMPKGFARLYRNQRFARFIARQFDRVYYRNLERTVLDTRWLGVPAVKYPGDMWAYQEIVFERRPDLIVETGTYMGGSAVFLGSLCELLDRGRVISIDLHPQPELPEHPRVTYMAGSSTDPEIAESVHREAAGKRVLVILDSDHRCDHVLDELRTYADIVAPGDYLIVEDTNINGNPVLREFGRGPTEAIEIFLRERTDFEIDRGREKFFHTANPGGFLRRIDQS